MTVDDLISSMQDIMGPSYTVSRHTPRRTHPQVDVRPEPAHHDPDGNLYGVTFTIREADLKETPEDREKLLAALWASVCDQDIEVQIQRGKATSKVK